MADNEPITDGRFFFPPEWYPHEATILGFPSVVSVPVHYYEASCREIVDLATGIAHFEPVRLYTRPEDNPLAEKYVHDRVPVYLQPRVSIIPIAINHCWVRDTGPVYVHDATGKYGKQRFAISFEFNEWGNKRPWDESNGNDYGLRWPQPSPIDMQENTEFARRVIESDVSPSPVRRVVSKIKAEGGAFVVDGDGTLIVSESCMIDEPRNPGMTKADIEEELRRVLGVEKIIWCPGRKNMDITDAHLDAEVRFIRPGVVLWSRHHPESDQGWMDISHEVLNILKKETDAKGRKLRIIPIDEVNGDLVPHAPNEEVVGSYINFYFCNGGVVIPKYGVEPADSRALADIQAAMPDREVRQVYLNAIPITGGVIHCTTQQVPALKQD